MQKAGQNRQATLKIIIKTGQGTIQVLEIAGDAVDSVEKILEILAKHAARCNWLEGAKKLTNYAKNVGKAGIVLQAGVAVLDVSLQSFVLATQGAAGHYKAYYDAPGARAVRMICGESPERLAQQVKQDMNSSIISPEFWGYQMGKSAHWAYELAGQAYEEIVNFFK
jgi:hypothetical protein